MNPFISTAVAFSLLLSLTASADRKIQSKTETSLFKEISDTLLGNEPEDSRKFAMPGTASSWQQLSSYNALNHLSGVYSASVVSVSRIEDKPSNYRLNVIQTPPKAELDELSIFKMNNLNDCSATLTDAFELRLIEMKTTAEVIGDNTYLPNMDALLAKHSEFFLVMIPISGTNVPVGVASGKVVYSSELKANYQIWVVVKRGKGGPLCAAL